MKTRISWIVALCAAAATAPLAPAVRAQDQTNPSGSQDQAPAPSQPQGSGDATPPSIPPPPPADAGGPPPAADAPADPPARVARLNFVRGPITVQPSGSADWIDANPNRPLTTGDHLWTDADARGEMHVGSTAIRLSDHVGASILNLTDSVAQFQLAQGSIVVRIRQLAPNETFEVDTANLAFTARAPGEYRIDADPNGGGTTITVRGGSGEVAGSGGGPYPIQFNRRYAIAGDLGSAPDERPAQPRDDFDRWADERARREEQSASSRYVSRDVIGYDDLDEHGYWRNDPVYGWLWVPNGTDGGWAPYHHGHWANVYPWGWTWVADESWGFAPYHYGRWVQGGYGWAWLPGPRGPRPYYSPAMVGWVGGAGFGATVSFGGVAGVGWYPLGPRDVWVPTYRASAGYVQYANVYNTRNVNVVQVNNYYGSYRRNPSFEGSSTYGRMPGAVTAVPRGAFVGGQAAGAASFRVTPGELSRPQVVHPSGGFGGGGGLVPPPGHSIPGAARPSSIRPPAALADRPVFTRTAPSPRASAFGGNRPMNAAGRAGGGQFGQPGAARTGVEGGAHPGQGPAAGGAPQGHPGGVHPGPAPAAAAHGPAAGRGAPAKPAAKKPAPKKKPAPRSPHHGSGPEKERR